MPQILPQIPEDQGISSASKQTPGDHGETDKQHEVGEELIHGAVPFQRRS